MIYKFIFILVIFTRKQELIMSFSETENKQIVLLKCWVKLSTGGGGLAKSSLETFEKDWEKLQDDIVERVGMENGAMFLIRKALTEIEDYINNEFNDALQKM